jgi:hypothetical protein
MSSNCILSECVVCFDNNVTHIFKKCSHACLCDDCATNYKPNHDGKYNCCICNTPSVSIGKLYFPAFSEEKLEQFIKSLPHEEKEKYNTPESAIQTYTEKNNEINTEIDNIKNEIHKNKKVLRNLSAEVDELCNKIASLMDLRSKFTETEKKLEKEFENKIENITKKQQQFCAKLDDINKQNKTVKLKLRFAKRYNDKYNKFIKYYV